jgi:hypothetical protein
MVGRGDDESWGAKYFVGRWTEEKAAEAGQHHREMLLERKYEQVLVVPSEPLTALVASPLAGDLVSEETIYAANLALWHIAGFNQLVLQHTWMLASALFEINRPNTAEEDLIGIATAIGAQTTLLHRRGVGEPDEPGGWYRRLRTAVNADIGRLATDRQWKRLYGMADAAALLLLMGAVAAFAWAVFH